MRIVTVFMEPPVPFGNAGSRWFYVLLRDLVRRGHDVTAFAGSSNARDADECANWFPPNQYDLRIFPSQPGAGWARRIDSALHPYSYVFGDDLRQQLRRELARGYDVLHLEQLWSGWLGLEERSRALLNVHYLFRIDQTGHPPASTKERLLRARTRLAEAYLLRQYRWLSTLTPRLTAHVREINPSAEVSTVPMAFETALYPFAEPNSEPVVGLIGSFNWTPTYLAGVRLITKLWPEISRRVPEARLHIAGRAARSAFANHADVKGIELHQDVDDILPHFRKLAVMLYAPSVGSGMKTKIVEAFAQGIPVVTNSEGTEGLPVQSGIHASVCEDDAGLIERTVALLRNPGAGLRMASAARTLVEQHCSPATILDRVEALYGDIRAVSRPKAISTGAVSSRVGAST